MKKTTNPKQRAMRPEVGESPPPAVLPFPAGGIPVESAPLDPADAPLPIPEEAMPTQERPQFCIFVSYQAGTKLRSQTLFTPFQDIDTEEALLGVMRFLTDSNKGKKIDLLWWRPLDG